MSRLSRFDKNYLIVVGQICCKLKIGAFHVYVNGDIFFIVAAEAFKNYFTINSIRID